MRQLGLAILGMTAVLCSQAFAADPIPNSKAAEYSLHRIERLVILHKIDAAYQTRFEGLALTVKTAQTPADPTFDIVGAQVAGQDGTSMTIDLLFDAIGRPMSYTTSVGSVAANPPAWPQKDAITIAENSLHWLEDQGPVVDALKPYFGGMTSLALAPVMDAQGALVGASVSIRIADNQPTLLVSMGLDGVFASYTIVSR